MNYVLMDRIKVTFEHGKLLAYLYTETLEEAENLAKLSKQTCEISEVLEDVLIAAKLNYMIKWQSTEAIDLLGRLDACSFGNWLKPINPTYLVCNFKKSRSDAVAPTKAHVSDSGYDLVLLEKIKSVGDVDFYTTGISVDPPHGYYFDMLPRSSISKTGYMLANSTGVIDQSYRGDVIVPLRKVDPNAGDLILPAKLVQLIPRQWYNMLYIEQDDLDMSTRGDGGFGSTS